MDRQTEPPPAHTFLSEEVFGAILFPDRSYTIPDVFLFLTASRFNLFLHLPNRSILIISGAGVKLLFVSALAKHDIPVPLTAPKQRKLVSALRAVAGWREIFFGHDSETPFFSLFISDNFFPLGSAPQTGHFTFAEPRHMSQHHHDAPCTRNLDCSLLLFIFGIFCLTFLQFSRSTWYVGLGRFDTNIRGPPCVQTHDRTLPFL